MPRRRDDASDYEEEKSEQNEEDESVQEKEDGNRSRKNSQADAAIETELGRNDTMTLTSGGDTMGLAGKEIIASSYQPDRTTSERVIKNYVKSYLFKYVSRSKRLQP